MKLSPPPLLQVHADYPRANASAVIHTKFGTFYDAVCYAPSARPVAAGLFFYSFTLSTAFVVLSLFVSVITSVMCAFRGRDDAARPSGACEAEPPLPPSLSRLSHSLTGSRR